MGSSATVSREFLNAVVNAAAKPDQNGETQVVYLDKLRYREGRLARVRAEAIRYLNETDNER